MGSGMGTRRKFFPKRKLIMAWWVISAIWCLATVFFLIIPKENLTGVSISLLTAIALVAVPPLVLLLLGQAIFLGQALVSMMRDSRS